MPFTDNSAKFLAAVKQGAAVGLNKTAQTAARQMRANMGSDGDDSYPGSFPGIESGALKRGLKQSQTATPEALSSAVGSEEEYWKYLEFGTSQMEPRPFVNRSIREALPDMKAEMMLSVVNATRKWTKAR